MNPFELTKDQYGSITVRIKSECVVLTREETRRIEERFIGISGENAKLRSLVRQWYPHMLKRVGRDALEQWGQMDVVKELGIEVTENE